MRGPDLARAERMAGELFLQYGRLPVCPLTLLRAQAGVSVHTYAEAAELMGQTPAAFDRSYPDVDAFTVHAADRWVVAYRSDGNPARRRFTLAHELGHIVLHHDTADSVAEREADHFASCLLCPEPILTQGEETIAVKCFVSPMAARMALRRQRYLWDKTLLERVEACLKANDPEA